MVIHVFPDEMSIREARDKLRGLVGDGHQCPVCTQMAKVYRRPLTAVAAAALIAIYRETPTGFVHLPTVAKERLSAVAHQGGYLTLGSYWGLIEEQAERREDGGRAGWWRLTEVGRAFVLDQARVQKYARIYDGRALSLDGEPIGIKDVLGAKFDYAALMRGEG